MNSQGIIREPRRSKRLKSSNVSEVQTCSIVVGGKDMQNNPQIEPLTNHSFSVNEIESFRQLLLEWYSLKKRTLPWRNAEVHSDPNVRFYAVWVSEVMLQQTQVATVIKYYKEWMRRWPTVTDLSKATLEDVNQVWSGLGYYSRAKRLLETSKLVEDKLSGIAPQTAAELEKLPGIGKYTACAIASIAFNEVKGVVDGNVMRVLTRLRAVGAEVDRRDSIDWLWKSVNELVDPNRPGDFNQALMEFGATVCTPKSPSCASCTLQSHCWAYKKNLKCKLKSEIRFKSSKSSISKQTEIDDIECVPDCILCLPRSEYDTDLGVMNYPRKSKKKAPREDHVAVAILYRNGHDDKYLKYFMVQRPEKGLLASLWEFPNVPVDKMLSEDVQKHVLLQALGASFDNNLLAKDKELKLKGKVLHIFSHVRCTYNVYAIEVDWDKSVADSNFSKWVTRCELQKSAISTAMKKVFKVFEESGIPLVASNESKLPKKRKQNSSGELKKGVKQMTLSAFTILKDAKSP